MKKSKLALLLGALLSLFVLAGCPSPAGTPENPPEPQPETEYVTVTFDAGTGAVFSNNKQTFTQRVEKKDRLFHFLFLVLQMKIELKFLISVITQ